MFLKAVNQAPSTHLTLNCKAAKTKSSHQNTSRELLIRSHGLASARTTRRCGYHAWRKSPSRLVWSRQKNTLGYVQNAPGYVQNASALIRCQTDSAWYGRIGSFVTR